MVIIFFNDLIIFKEKLFVVLEDVISLISWAGREKKAFSSLYVVKLIKGLF